MEDAELSAWSFSALDTLLRKKRHYCQQMLTILGEKMAENQAIAKALAHSERADSDITCSVTHAQMQPNAKKETLIP